MQGKCIASEACLFLYLRSCLCLCLFLSLSLYLCLHALASSSIIQCSRVSISTGLLKLDGVEVATGAAKGLVFCRASKAIKHTQEKSTGGRTQGIKQRILLGD